MSLAAHFQQDTNDPRQTHTHTLVPDRTTCTGKWKDSCGQVIRRKDETIFETLANIQERVQCLPGVHHLQPRSLEAIHLLCHFRYVYRGKLALDLRIQRHCKLYQRFLWRRENLITQESEWHTCSFPHSSLLPPSLPPFRFCPFSSL
jgi:hypothetical protein